MIKQRTYLHYALALTALFSTGILVVHGVGRRIEENAIFPKKHQIEDNKTDFDTYVEEPNGWGYLITKNKADTVRLYDNLYLRCEGQSDQNKTGNDLFKNVSIDSCNSPRHNKTGQAIFTPVTWGNPHVSFHEKKGDKPSGPTKIASYRFCNQNGTPLSKKVELIKRNNTIEIRVGGERIGSLPLSPYENNNYQQEEKKEEYLNQKPRQTAEQKRIEKLQMQINKLKISQKQQPQSQYQPQSNLTEEQQLALAINNSLEQPQSYQQNPQSQYQSQSYQQPQSNLTEEQQLALAINNSLEQPQSYQQNPQSQYQSQSNLTEEQQLALAIKNSLAYTKPLSHQLTGISQNPLSYQSNRFSMTSSEQVKVRQERARVDALKTSIEEELTLLANKKSLLNQKTFNQKIKNVEKRIYRINGEIPSTDLVGLVNRLNRVRNMK
jgi:hypothetical protein